jgi:hypothetical protein
MVTAIAPVRQAQSPKVSLDELTLKVEDVNQMKNKGWELKVYDIKKLALAEGIDVREARSAILISCNGIYERVKGADVGAGKLAVYLMERKPESPTLREGMRDVRPYEVIHNMNGYFNELLKQS